jgi:heptosyltransferase-2
VIQTSYLGDLVLTTPLLAELATRGPVDVITTPAAAAVLANHPAVRSVIPYDKRGDGRGIAGIWRAAHALRARYARLGRGAGTRPARRGGAATSADADQQMPVAYLAQGSIRSAMLALLAGCGDRVGFATSAGRTLYTRRVPYRPDRHHAERLWLLAAQTTDAEPPPAARQLRLYPGRDDLEAVDLLLRAAAYRGEPLIALAPGSAWGTKRWPYYPALAAALRPRYRIVVVGGPADRDLARDIIGAAGADGARMIDATGRLTPLATTALLGQCATLIANDSAPQHLAAAAGTPTVSIFGPTVPEFGYWPLAPRHEIAGHSRLTCRPCDRHGPSRCPLGHWRCMREIQVADVVALIARVTAAPHFS